MSTVSPISSPALPLVSDPAGTEVARTRTPEARTGTVTVPDAAPGPTDIVTELGLLGLRAPAARGDIGVLLAQTLLATEEARGDGEKREALNRSNAVLSTLLGLNNNALTAKLATDTAARTRTETQRTAAVAQRDELQGQVATLTAAIGTKQDELNAAKAVLASAEGETARAAAQAQVNALSGELSALQGQLGLKTTALTAANQTLATLEGELARLVDAIAATGRQIDAFGSLVQSVSALLSTGLRNEDTSRRSLSTQTDTLVERLFEAMTEMGLERGRSADPLLAGRNAAVSEDTPDRDAPPRVETVAAALSIAFADLLSELKRVEPLALAHPADQTGRERFRLEV
ncbi:hypothetical protein [uncultured Aureimonas sp.]|uniref:hypothetical protein n=1 Tax=uncultured Aureimonas sp. TaxID=1604662 RepID=UPI0025E28D50|nr:hypothetical protein [uncultured Aureimonas sp.]